MTVPMDEDDAMVVILTFLRNLSVHGDPADQQERILVQALQVIVLAWARRA